jgi:cytochrome c5
MMSALLAAGLLAPAAAPAGLEAQRSGVEIWSQTCGRCHLPQPAIRYTADQWESIMLDMAIFARMTDDDAAAVLEFLKGGARRVASTEPAQRNERPVAVLASAGSIRVEAPDPQGAAGSELYSRNCSVCHGKTGRGDGSAAASLNPKPTNLADSTFQGSRTDDQLTEAIARGTGTMPGFGTRLGDDAVQALVAYIRTLNTGASR